MPVFATTFGSVSFLSPLPNPVPGTSISSSSSLLSYSRPLSFSFRPPLTTARPDFRIFASADESQPAANSTAVLDDSSDADDGVLRGPDESHTAASSTTVIDDSSDCDDAALQALMSADWKAAKAYAETGLIYEGKIEFFNNGGLRVRFNSLLGFLPFRELSPSHFCKGPRRSVKQVAASLVGSLISAKVIEADEENKRLIFSEKEAVWGKFAERVSVGDIFAGIVGSVEDYGAFIHLCFPDGFYHITGMVHVSELSWDLVQDARDVLSVGDEVRVKVTAIDRKKSRILLSMKQLEGDPFLETLEKVIPQDNLSGHDALDTTSSIEPLPGLEAIFDELLREDGVDDVRINRQGFEKRVVSQDLQLWLSNAPPVNRKFILLARAGRQVQEIQMTTSLDQEGIKKALQQALERVP